MFINGENIALPLWTFFSKSEFTKGQHTDYLVRKKNPRAGVSKEIDVDTLLGYHHHHHHVVPLAQISLTLSRHFSLSFIATGRSSGRHPVSSQSCCMYVRSGRPAFARPCVGIHRSTSLWGCPCFFSSVLHVWFV